MLLQLYGRFAIILGSLLVGILNVYAFSGIKDMDEKEVFSAYADIYFIALFILLISFKTIAINQDQLISENDLYYLFKNSLKKWNENVIFLDKKKSMAKITTEEAFEKDL